jgi:glycerol-3-phosphate acyltransferase PlsY
VVGTFPSTYVLARAKHARGLMTSAARREGERDAHILMVKHLGIGWTSLAATLDVLKGLVFVLVARDVGNVPVGWLALVGVALVVGHSFPILVREMAGRGLATAAGVFLALLPWEMVVCGVLIVLGRAIRGTSAATTVGLVSIPLIGAIQGQPVQLVAMASAIFVIIVIRRLEGVGEVIRGGVRPWRAAWYRAVFDSSGPPGGTVWPVGDEELP